jgi:hypothetical protein
MVGSAGVGSVRVLGSVVGDWLEFLVAVLVLVGFLRGHPGRRLAVGVGFCARGGMGAGWAAEVVAASTSGRNKMRLREPMGQPQCLRSLMLVVVIGELGSHGGGGIGGRTASWMMLSNTWGRLWWRPPPLLRGI